MHYPFWFVPGLTSPMLIAGIAVFHVFVSMYAVGGGFFLAYETRFAYRTGNREYLEYIRSHAWFFILVTVVYGAITGVGIWWTIGLASPLPTEFLIHVFVFGWAMEYVTFILEIISAFIFYYAWGILSPKVHQRFAWIYAFSAWASLFIITGIIAFMLNPGNWQGNFWRAFFNPQAIPQILTRTGASFLLATLYVYLHASFKAKSRELRNLISRRSALPAMMGCLLITLGGIGWILTLPESSRAAIAGASVLNVLMGLIFALTVIVFFMFYLGPYRNPDWVGPGFAILFFLIGLIVTGATEFVREAVRKPFVIYGEVYSHNVYPREIPRLQQEGFLEGGVWTRHYLEKNFPELIGEDGKINEFKMETLEQDRQILLGKTVFNYHCGSCHAVRGYSGMREILIGWNSQMIGHLIMHLNRYRCFMPPWSGSPGEALVLKKYLETLSSPYPIEIKESENLIHYSKGEQA